MKRKAKQHIHRYQIVKRPDRVEYTLGEFIGICIFCLEWKFIKI